MPIEIDDYGNGPGDTLQAAGAIAIGGQAIGTLEAPDDRDVFRVDLLGGLTYVIQMWGAASGAGTLPDPFLRLLDAGGAEIRSDDDTASAADSRILFSCRTSGSYVLEASTLDVDTGTYTLSIVALSGASSIPDDHPDAITDTGRPFAELIANSPIAATLELPFDVDLFRLSLVAGQTYTIDMTPRDPGSDAAMTDTYLTLLDSLGDVLRLDDDTNDLDAQIVFTPTASGIYYIQASGFDDDAGAYTLTMTAAGSAISGAAAGPYVGGDGADTIEGRAGADQMAGGAGDDTYRVDTQADVIFELADGGRDTVISTVSFYLYAWIENLDLSAGTAPLFGSGNAQANMITGNAGGNALYGWGGDDTLQGGDGIDLLFGLDDNDLLRGDAGNDVLLGGGGNDTAEGGAASDALYGQEGDDSLVGGSGAAFDLLVGDAGNDTLDGIGGVPGDVDYLYGGTGDDVYRVDTSADLAVEFAGEGNDTVEANFANGGYYLFQEIEGLRLLGATYFGVGNALANSITGSDFANLLIGGAGDDTIEGAGGNDVLYGEGGADRFVMRPGTAGDAIYDFTPGTDKILVQGFAAFKSHAQLLISAGGPSTVVNFGNGDFVVVVNVAPGALSATDFLFG